MNGSEFVLGGNTILNTYIKGEAQVQHRFCCDTEHISVEKYACTVKIEKKKNRYLRLDIRNSFKDN